MIYSENPRRKRRIDALHVTGVPLLICSVLIPACTQVQELGSAHPAAPQSAINSPLRVELLRGLWDVFSLGLNSLADELQAQNVDAVARSGTNWRAIAESIVADFEDGADTRPLVLVGHSYGADEAVSVARFLHDRDIPVELLYLIDATDPAPIPDNVKSCVHLYLPNPLGHALPDLFSGNPVVPEGGNDFTDIVNVVFNEPNFGPGTRGADHFNIEENPVAHALVIDEILQIVHPE